MRSGPIQDNGYDLSSWLVGSMKEPLERGQRRLCTDLHDGVVKTRVN